MNFLNKIKAKDTETKVGKLLKLNSLFENVPQREGFCQQNLHVLLAPLLGGQFLKKDHRVVFVHFSQLR